MLAKSLAVSRRALIVMSALMGCSMFIASTDVANAGIGASSTPSFPSVVQVGQAGYGAFILVTNQNSVDPPGSGTPRDDTGQPNIVCNASTVVPCSGEPGITLTPSCGLLAAGAVCAVAGSDPRVLKVSSTGKGSADSSCPDMLFNIEEISATTGQLRFTPIGGQSVVLPSLGKSCKITFTFDVLKMPTIDQNANAAGVQTIQLTDNTQYSGFITGQGRGTTFGITVTPATPTLATVASAGVGISGQISDTATITGRISPVPGATVTFTAYGPNDAACTSAPVFTSTVPVVEASSSATSAAFTPVVAGVYRWTATYSGDANNAAASDVCNAANESVTVTPVTPTIATAASGTVPINQPITDTATVSGRVTPLAGATITFNLYGPNDANCTGAVVFTSTKPVDANGSATSSPYAPTAAGTYRWVASYSGDANNVAVAEPCNSANESVTVTAKPTTPTLATTASGTVAIGGVLTDQATVSGRQNPAAGATVTFKAYGPNDATCANTPVFTSTVPIDTNGSAGSGPFTPATAGTYRWVATYNGDVNNASVSGVCGESSEITTVTPAAPTLVTVASVNTATGGVVTDTAQVSGRINPVAGATVSFGLYGPDDANCSRSPVFISTVALNADGTATSAPFSPSLVGTYRWIAGYSGDVNNAAVTAACNAPNEAVALLGPDLQQSLPATGARTAAPLVLGSLFLLAGAMLLLGVRRRTLLLRTWR